MNLIDEISTNVLQAVVLAFVFVAGVLACGYAAFRLGLWVGQSVGLS